MSDLQYAMMVSTGSLTSSTTVVTMVHDCQIIDLPEDLFGPHDVPVDCIVTPTRVIWCTDQSNFGDDHPSKPAGVIWSLLGPNDLNRVPALKRIRYREWKSGKDIRLSGEENDPADLSDVILPDHRVGSHGDHKKSVASRPGEVDGGDIVDKTKHGSVKAMADDRKPARYGEFF